MSNNTNINSQLTPSGVSSSTPPQSSTVSSQLQQSTDHTFIKFDYSKHNLIYITDHIKFADQKAGIGLTIALALIGFFGHQLKGLSLSSTFDTWTLAKLLSILGLIIGILSLGTAAWFFLWKVIWPRYITDPRYFLSWGGISCFTEAEYESKMKGTDTETLIREMSIQNHNLSIVCTSKFQNLKNGFAFLAVGVILTSFSWFFGM